MAGFHSIIDIFEKINAVHIACERSIFILHAQIYEPRGSAAGNENCLAALAEEIIDVKIATEFLIEDELAAHLAYNVVFGLQSILLADDRSGCHNESCRPHSPFGFKNIHWIAALEQMIGT